MGKYTHKEVKELSEYVKAHTKKKYDLPEGLMAEKSVSANIQKVNAKAQRWRKKIIFTIG